jgi:hypothetical protein
VDTDSPPQDAPGVAAVPTDDVMVPARVTLEESAPLPQQQVEEEVSPPAEINQEDFPVHDEPSMTKSNDDFAPAEVEMKVSSTDDIQPQTAPQEDTASENLFQEQNHIEGKAQEVIKVS